MVKDHMISAISLTINRAPPSALCAILLRPRILNVSLAMKDCLIGGPCPHFDVPKDGKLRLVVRNITKHVFVPRPLGDVAESGFDGFRGCAGINIAASGARVRRECSVRSKRCEFRGHSLELDSIFQPQSGSAAESAVV